MSVLEVLPAESGAGNSTPDSVLPDDALSLLVRRLVKMTAGYGLIQWAGPFLSFFFTPIITRLLTPADYGVADYINTIGFALGVGALLAMPQALTAHFNDQPTNAWRRQITGTALATVLLSGTLMGLILLALTPVLARFSPIAATHQPLFWLVGATLIFSLGSAVLTSAAQAALQVRWGMILSLTSILFTVFGNVFYIVVLRWGVTGYLLTPITTSIATFVVGLVLARRLVGRPSWPVARQLMRSGLWLLPAAFANWGLQVADRLFLGQYVSATELGYYAIANKIATLLFVMINPLLTAYTPLALSIQHRPDARQRYATLSRYLLSAVLCAGLGLGLFAKELLIVFTRPAYLPGADYVGFRAYMHIFGAMYTILYTAGLAGKEFKGISWAVVAGAGVNLLLNYWLIPLYHLWGAIAAMFVGCAVSPLMLYFWLRRTYPVPYPVGRILAALAVQLTLLVAGLYLPAVNVWLRLGMKLGLFCLLPAWLWLSGMVTTAEIQAALRMLTALFPLVRHGLRGKR